MEKNKIQNKQISVTSIKWLEMDDEELYVPDDILEDASASRYQMLTKKSKLRNKKEVEKLCVNENQ
jgi:hypothetical protein